MRVVLEELEGGSWVVVGFRGCLGVGFGYGLGLVLGLWLCFPTLDLVVALGARGRCGVDVTRGLGWD